MNQGGLSMGEEGARGHDYVWNMKRIDPEAVAFFKSFLARFLP
jgi:hypothetical protein